MSILKAFAKKDHARIIHYVVVIEAPLEVVGTQLAGWFTNAWRPSDAVLKYKCAESGPVKIGSKCRGEFTKFLKAGWQLEIERLEGTHVIHAKLKGFFTGTETVTVEERDNGIKVDYRMTYELRNPIAQIMWLWMQEPFVDEIRKSMEALKAFCQKAK
jgi:hypothetical protein